MTVDREALEHGTTTATPLNLSEYEAAARAVLPEMMYWYLDGAACDRITFNENRLAFGRWRLLPRVLRGLGEVDLSTKVLGQEISLPVMLAPVGMHRTVHDEGELATARAANAAGTIFTLSTVATYPIEEVAPLCDRWWYQLYIYKDREVTRDLVRRAEAAGAGALVVTVDTPVLGRREMDERGHFVLPEHVTIANIERSVRGLERMPRNAAGSALSAYTSNFDASLSWADLDWLASITRLPVVPKGILAAADARLAVEHGAKAIIVSNHGGRQLDGSVATLDALPAIAREVNDEIEVYLDGGIR
ncbi:MAG TPA: alpha-hydroxy acid oxidase, partial [Thermomicrobiaceae bacterium]|nr:alpha-hydroxy acid oxidase [Thermomicrobiaceae bacterium]